MRGDLEIHRYVRAQIEQARVLAELSKSELARRLHKSKGAYLDLDSGRRKTIDVSFLIQIAEVTERKVSFFLPDAEACDVATVIKQAYPDLTTASLGEILDFACDLQKRDRYAHSGDSRESDTSNVHTGDTNG
jgi:transcriptional regulator with XRE-family HTH domain